MRRQQHRQAAVSNVEAAAASEDDVDHSKNTKHIVDLSSAALGPLAHR